MIIQSYARGISGVRAANPAIKLRLGRDPALPNEPILLVAYPHATDDPAGRDVWCDAEQRDWTSGKAVSFQAKPLAPERLSVSFLDRNRVAYTTWFDLEAGIWQAVRVAFDQLRPNPYFQPPDAKTGAPIDVSEVGGIAFAPHQPASGQLAVGRFALSNG